MDVEPSVPGSIDPIAVITTEETAIVSEQRWASGTEWLAPGRATTKTSNHEDIDRHRRHRKTTKAPSG